MADKPVAMTRDEEKKLSRTSPGKTETTANPPVISIYNFAIDDDALKPEHVALLAEVASMLKQAKSDNMRVQIIGHTDDSGEFWVNDPLSIRRANAVEKALKGSGVPMSSAGLGEDVPFVANTTVDARSRNRRVDIHMQPRRRDPKPIPEDPEKKPEEKKKEKGPEEDTWFCESFPLICASIVGGAALLALLGAGLWFCINNPLACLPELPGGDDDDDPEKKKKEKPRRRRPCPIDVRLPSGTLTANLMSIGRRHLLQRHFSMRLLFMNDDTGCECALGEYKQELKGWAERTLPGGMPKRDRVHLVGGLLDENTYREDARAGNPSLPYGHRGNLRGNTDEDSFLPDRETGCRYAGEDEPGMQTTNEGERMQFHFEFRGAPVDARTRLPVLPWRHWIVEGDGTTPGGPPPKPPEPPEPKKDEEPNITQTPKPYQGPSMGPAPSNAPQGGPFCWGGSIACATSDFLQERSRKETLLTEDSIRSAIEIEARVLRRYSEPPLQPVPNIFLEDPVQKWAREIRERARVRVLRFAKLDGLINTRYAR
jgi:hypothetical protein